MIEALVIFGILATLVGVAMIYIIKILEHEEE
jgi:hypothetical protein